MIHLKKFTLIILCMMIFGCSQTVAEKTSPKPFTHVVTVDTHYYLSGPQQGRPPEGQLKTGTKIVILNDSGSYVLIKSEGGVEAYISKGSFKKIQD